MYITGKYQIQIIMNELTINYKETSKTKKILNIIIAVYLGGFSLYFCFTEAVANRYGILFFCALAGFVLALILLFINTLWQPATLLRIDSNTIISHLPKQSKATFDWTNVSRVNIGVSYIIFLVNGEQKQRKMDLSVLMYEDVMNVKSKIIEICEYKNIPYHND